MALANLKFNIALAFRSLRKSKMRSSITIGIIALGIMALVGILTATEGLKASIYNNFSGMGANSFQITNQVLKTTSEGMGFNRRRIRQEKIEYRQAIAFQERFTFPAMTGVSMLGTGTATVTYASEKTNPNIRVFGVDDRYLHVSSTNLDLGRNFTPSEVHSGAYVCILGNGIAQKLFGDAAYFTALGKKISVGYVKYTVVGVAEKKGGSMSGNMDNYVFVPLQNARSVYGGDASFVISIFVPNIALIDLATEEAEGLFRQIRELRPGEGLNFGIMKNDNLASMVLQNITFVSGAALFIGLITLLGAAIGLMNIMLVSVSERTREIGVSKALGARNSTIKNQFLTESLLISLLGGLLGILMGILFGNIVSLLLGVGFVIPWAWVLVGILLCTGVGLLSGVFPAAKAARLDPIQALRYE